MRTTARGRMSWIVLTLGVVVALTGMARADDQEKAKAQALALNEIGRAHV